MKTIGLIGGMSWESTANYYRIINQETNRRLGGLHSAKIILTSVDFAEIEQFQSDGDWNAAANRLSEAAQSLESAGADFFLICTNTMHKVAEQVQASVRIPLLHIADATADVLKAKGVKNVGLLGTRFTMEESFYKDRLQNCHDIEVVTPGPQARERVHEVIFDELCLGKLNDSSRQDFLRIIAKMAETGSKNVILGCTEISMLVNNDNCPSRLFDTTEIHAAAAVDWALRN